MNARWNEITALFGGTFDPPHQGHVAAVEGLLRAPAVQNIRVLPAATPPLKDSGTLTPPEHRVAMTKLAFAELIKSSGTVEIDPIEVIRAERTPAVPSYSIDTVLQLRSEYPRLAFVIGSDQLSLLPQWHRARELIKLCHWIVLRRSGASTPGSALAELSASGWISRTDAQGRLMHPGDHAQVLECWAIPGSSHTFNLVATHAPALSSTEIRKTLLRTGSAPENALSAAVFEYLKLHRLYGT